MIILQLLTKLPCTFYVLLLKVYIFSRTLRGNLSTGFMTKASTINLKSNFSSFAVHESPEPISDDKFTKEFLTNRIQATQFQKCILSAGASLASLIDPHRYKNLILF